MRANYRHDLDRWLAIHQPRLNLSVDEAGLKQISGFFDLTHTEGGNPPLVYESFEIEFVFQKDFPAVLPTVFETGDRIERKSENHINGDGSICYGVPIVIAARRPDLTLDEFISEILHDYFLGYLHFIETGGWPFGEVGHGYAGAIEYLAELLGCEAKPNKVKALLSLLSLKHRRDRWSCPCGSKKRLGDCCREALNRASLKITRYEAIRLCPLIVRHAEEAADAAGYLALVDQVNDLKAKRQHDKAASLDAGRKKATLTTSIRTQMFRSVSYRAVRIRTEDVEVSSRTVF